METMTNHQLPGRLYDDVRCLPLLFLGKGAKDRFIFRCRQYPSHSSSCSASRMAARLASVENPRLMRRRSTRSRRTSSSNAPI